MNIILFIVCSLISTSTSNENADQYFISIHIHEELPLSTILFTTPTNILYRLFDSARNQNSFISYNTTNGQILLSHPLDREALCTSHICSCIRCQLTIELIEWQSPYRIFQLILILEDINDHPPRFSSENYQFHLQENIPLGLEFPLESAEDQDLDENSRISYELRNASNAPFQLLMKSNGQLVLKVIEEIDREQRDFYQFDLLAFDHGQPRRESSTKLSITIDDMNDNPVVLSQTYLHLHLSENTPIGTELTSINASDKDIGLNGKIHYSLNHGYPTEYFHIGEFTGILTLINALDYELEQSYRLIIQVRDLGENSLAQFVTIDISIIDENDNTPQAFITFVQTLVNNSIISLVENTPIGQILAHVSISDRDSGMNGRLSCKILQGNEIIGMKNVDERSFFLVIDHPIDREDKRLLHRGKKLILLITDHGQPAKSIQLEYPIEIVDVNDTPPRFSSSSSGKCQREFSPFVNRSFDEPLFEIHAIDDDLDDNGRISYFILPPYDRTFSIDEQGRIFHLNEFNQSFYHLRILAMDHGENIRLNSTYDCFISITMKNNSQMINKSIIRRNYWIILLIIISLVLLMGIGLGFLVYKLIIYPRRYFQPNKTYHLYVSLPRKSRYIDQTSPCDNESNSDHSSDKDSLSSRTVRNKPSLEISRPVSMATTCTTSNSMLIQLTEQEQIIS